MAAIDYLDTITGVTYNSRFDMVHDVQADHAWRMRFRLPALDSYKFKRKNADLDQELCDLLYRLRNQFRSVNLWYSGGLDSHWLLREFIRHDIPLDEIFVTKKLPFDSHPYSLLTAEELFTAIPYLDKASRYIKRHDIQVTFLTVGSVQYEQHFRHGDWIKHINHGETRNPGYVSNVLRQFGIDNTGSQCHLLGAETPIFFYDQGWRFYFIDKQLIPETVPGIFKPTSHDSAFCEAYANSIIDRLERYSDYQTRFAKNHAYTPKWFKQTLPQMEKTNGDIWVQLPSINLEYSPTADTIERLNSKFSFKDFLDYRSAKELNPKWFQHYCYLTDWASIERDYRFPGVLTQTFEIC